MWMKYVYTDEILQWMEFDYDIKKNCIFRSLHVSGIIEMKFEKI